MNKLMAIGSCILLPLLIGGCGTSQQKPTEASLSASTTNTSTNILTTTLAPTIDPTIDPTQGDTAEYGRFDTDTLYSLLVAEVAASRKDYDTTIANYVEQANATNDITVITRAARIAQFFRQREHSLDMGLLWLKQAPNNLEAVTLVANAYLELRQPLKALDYAEQILALLAADKTPTKKPRVDNDDQQGGAFLETIANLSKASDKDTLTTLISRFKTISQRYPARSSIKVGLSVLHQANGSNTDASLWIERALVQTPTRKSAVIQDVILLQETKQTELAISKLKRLLDKTPSDHRIRLVYARLLSQTNIPEAYEQFTLLSEQSPNQLDLAFSRALLAVELEKIDVAKPLLRTLLASNYQNNSVLFYLGHIEELASNPEAALDHYLAIESDENFLPAQFRSGRIMISLDRVDDANRLFANLRQTHPDKKERIYETQASLLVKQKADNTALPLLNNAITKYPDNFNLRYERSTIHERQNNIALMESDLRHILNLDPDNVHALNGLGYFLTIRTDRYEEAYTLIKQALTLKPTDAAIIDSMGWVNFKLGRLEEAVTHLKKAYAIHPDPEVAAHLSEALWVSGDKEKAKDILQENLQKNPAASEILDMIQRLNIPL